MVFKKNIPNMLTCGNLVCGCIATMFAFSHLFLQTQHSHVDMHLLEMAFLFILFGAVFDFFDGFVARLLGVSGPLGVQLDSLADVVTFGVAPSSMIFALFTQVYYPEMLQDPFWFKYLPYTAFLLAAFSAFRLAKFNIDERQHTGFIGMPTPACAIFWGALISSSEDFLRSPRFNAAFLLAFVLMFCFLLVSEIPMFALKFKNYNLRSRENVIKFGFLACCLILLVVCGVIAPEGHTWQYICRGIAGSIGLYILINLVLHVIPSEAPSNSPKGERSEE